MSRGGGGEVHRSVKAQEGGSVTEAEIYTDKSMLTLSFAPVFFRGGSQVGTIGRVARSHDFGMGKEGYVLTARTIQEIGDTVEQPYQHITSMLRLGGVSIHGNGLVWADLRTVVGFDLSGVQAGGFKFGKHFNF